MTFLRRSVFVGIAVVISLLLLYTGSRALLPSPSLSLATDHVREFSRLNFQNSRDGLRDIQNETLGFERVYVISLPARTDKRDAMAVQASLSNIRHTIVNGVDSDTVIDKALPYTMGLRGSVLGCWRAHMNVLQDIVENRVSSALIFEDDADWDVALRPQLVQFARGTRYLQNIPDTTKVRAPYGDDWDMFWLGHCGVWPEPLDRRRFVIPHDVSVVPPAERRGMIGASPNLSRWESGPESDNRTRIMYAAEGGVCLAAYGISLRGATKALYHMSMLPYNAPVDWGYNDMCKAHSSNFTCIGIYPPLMGVHRAAGNTTRNSDIGYFPDSEGVVEETGHTERVVFSTRLNVDRMLAGDDTFQSQYPAYTGTNLTIEEIGGAIGHPELLREDELDSILAPIE